MVSTMRFASTTCHFLSLSLFEKGNQKEKPRFASCTPDHHYIRSYMKTLKQCNHPGTQCFSTWMVDIQYRNDLPTMTILFNDDFTNHLGYLCDYSWVVYFVHSQAMENSNNKPDRLRVGVPVRGMSVEVWDHFNLFWWGVQPHESLADIIT